MRKLIVLSLVGVLILAFGAAAYAQAPKLEFRASGYIDTQVFSGMNVPQYQSSPQTNYAVGPNTAVGTAHQLIPNLYMLINPNFLQPSKKGALFTAGVPFTSGTGSNGYNKIQYSWEGRAHLKFDAVMGPNLSGTIYFEIDSMRYSNNYASTTRAPWSVVQLIGREANAFGGWTTDRASVEVKNIYIDFGLPYFGIPVPITVRVGAQPIGVRPAMAVYSDGAGITAGIKIDPVLIAPILAYPVYGRDFYADKSTVYGLHANAKISTFTIGGYGLYYNMNTYPFWVLSNNAGQPSGGVSLSTLQGTNSANMLWLGAYADGKAGPVNINFDFVFDHGKVQRTGLQKLIPGVKDVRYQGWAGRLKVDFPWEKFNFGAVGMYATGSDADKTDPRGFPGNTTFNGTISRRVSGYVVPPGAEQSSADQESIVVYGMENGASGGYGIAHMINYAEMQRGGFGGTWFAKLYGSMKVTPWLKLTLQELYIGDTTKHGTTLGDAINMTTGHLRHSNTIGWETDLMADIMIYNNLRLWLAGGYLYAGGALDLFQANGVHVRGNFGPANPWAFRTRLQYTF